VIASQCPQLTPVTDEAFPKDVVISKGLNFIKKCKGVSREFFLRFLQVITGG